MAIAALVGCPSCGTEALAGARFCPGCGAELVEAREIRKTVSILVCDWVDSTSLGSGLDAESLRRVQESFNAEARRVLERHGGTVERFIGDAVMAVFGIPQAHEDDALRAVRAAVELREALASLNARLEKELGVRLEVRTAVNTGEVVAGDPSAGQAFVTGDPVVVTKRLEEAATSGEILIGEATRRLVRDAALVEVADDVPAKGKPEPLVAWRLLAVITGAPPFARRLDAPLVGRERELALLRQAFERAASGSSGYLFTVLGAAGIGKSRLVRELVGEAGDRSTVLVGRCLPYGDGITFWPLIDVVRRAAAIGNHLDAASARARIAELVAAEPEADLVAGRLASTVGLLDAQTSTEETFWAVRKLVKALARRRPVVLAFDDLQWAEPTFLDLVEHLAEWIRDLPVLLVCLARPELLEERPAWAGGWPNASTIMLEPLREPECGELVDGLLGAGGLPDETKQEIAAASEGNPLFVEELLAMLIEEEVLRRESGRWLAGDLSSMRAPPPTIQALLGARLDRLGRRERSVLEVASVAGRSFSRDSVAELIDEPGLDVLLGALIRSDLIRPELAPTGADGYRFRHLLIRDAAYAATPKEQRAHLHEVHAGWLERTHGDRLGEVEEIVGYHFEQAHRMQSELGRADEHLAARAGERLSAAGRRALARGDISAAANLLHRAAAVLPAAAPGRTELLPEFGSALVLAGEFEQAEAVLTEAIEKAGAARNRRLELHAQLERAFLRSLTGPEGSVEELRRISERAIPQLESLGDDLGLAKAWRRIADVHWMTNCWNEQELALERALVHAERAGDAREAAGALMRIALALYYGPLPAPAAIHRAEEILDRARGTRAVESTFIVSLAGLHAMSGRFDEARELFARGRAIIDELGLKVWLAGFSLVASDIEMLAGDPGTAEAHLRGGYEALHGMGDRGLLSTVAAALARAIYAQGRNEEAERFTEISEELDGRGNIASQIGWRATRGKVLAHRGDFEQAESLAREAVAIAERTDDLVQRGRALLDLAEVLELAHRNEEGAQLVETARDLFEQKGNVVVAEETRELLARLRV
jgi:class 3 adenylate cyclase/tetratricopeptide (TPR) repeat protein